MASPSTRRDRRSAAAPLVVEVVRGAMVESRHQASVAIVDPDGAVAAAWGDIDEPVYPRSALKPLQALPLVESGAAAAHGLDQPALAVATASHTGEPRHVEVVGRWLAGVGLGSGDLECGAHAPTNAAAAEALLRAGAAPTALHNNCSGKHTGILTTARHLDLPTAGYTAFDHPVQQLLRDTVGAVTGVDLDSAPRGIDGCSLPIYGMPLLNLAWGMARFAAPAQLARARAAAATALYAAMTAEPFMVAGSGRFCTVVMAALGGDAALKTGAEGVYCAALPGPALGVALKVADGATRAAEVAMAAILAHLGVLDEARAAELADRLTVPLHNWNGRHVGDVRMAPPLVPAVPD